MKRIIEYNISKEEVVRRISALIDGGIKASDLCLNNLDKYHGYITDDSFMICPKMSYDLCIRGEFKTGENVVELDIGYNVMRNLLFLMWNFHFVILFILTIIGQKYLGMMVILIYMVVGNSFLVWFMDYSVKKQFRIIHKLLTYNSE